MSDLDEFFVHTVTVQLPAGGAGMGDILTGPITLSPDTDSGVFVEDTRKLVRSPSGEEVISETTIYGRPTLAAVLVEDAQVTLPSGRVATVITTAAHDSAGLDLPDHVEANLT